MGDSADEDDEEELSQEMMLGFTQASQMQQETPNKVTFLSLNVPLACLTLNSIAGEKGSEESEPLEAMGAPRLCRRNSSGRAARCCPARGCIFESSRSSRGRE